MKHHMKDANIAKKNQSHGMYYFGLLCNAQSLDETREIFEDGIVMFTTKSITAHNKNVFTNCKGK